MNAASGSVTAAAGLPEQVLRHGLDAVHPGAQVDAVQVELEDLFLGELRFDQQRDPALLDLAGEGLHVREEDRAGELLGQGAAALHPRPAADVAHHRAAETDRIDSRMIVEAAILDRDDRVLQIDRDFVERDVMALLVEPEPGLAIGAVEHGVADAARQAVHRHRVARQPDAGHRGAADQRDQQRDPDPVRPSPRPQQAQCGAPLPSFFSFSSA